MQCTPCQPWVPDDFAIDKSTPMPRQAFAPGLALAVYFGDNSRGRSKDRWLGRNGPPSAPNAPMEPPGLETVVSFMAAAVTRMGSRDRSTSERLRRHLNRAVLFRPGRLERLRHPPDALHVLQHSGLSGHVKQFLNRASSSRKESALLHRLSSALMVLGSEAPMPVGCTPFWQ